MTLNISPFRICEKDRNKFCVSTEFRYERTDSEGRSCATENDSIVESILKDWISLIKIFDQALKIRDYLEDEKGDLYNLVAVEEFDYQSLSLKYGEDFNYRFKMKWLSAVEEYDLEFDVTGKKLEANPHKLVCRDLKREFNNHKNLAYLLQIIVKTTAPLKSLSLVQTHPALGTTTRPLYPLQNMTMVTQTSTHVRVFYRNIYVVDISFVDDGIVIRDGCFCKSDPTKQLGGVGPSENFTVFLKRFADRSEAVIASLDVDKNQRDGMPQVHHLSESPGQSFSSASMRSPAFPSPTSHATGVTTSTGAYASQLPSMSPANRYSGSSPAPAQSSASMGSPASWPHSPQLSQGSPLHTKSALVPATVGVSDQPGLSRPGNAASVCFMSTSAFARLITPVEHDFPGRRTTYFVSPLNRFFDSLYMLKHLVRVVRKDETLHLEKNENILMFSGSSDTGLLYSVFVNPTHLETLHLNINTKQGFENVWPQDELRVLKQFFEVVVTPCKLNSLTAFARLLGANRRILKDAMKIMRIEMQPDQNQKWLIEWSFMTPPAIVASIASPGTPAVVLKTKNLFYFQLTDVRDSNRRFVFSILYDTSKNIVQPTEFPHSADSPQEPPSWGKSARDACNAYLKEIAESVSHQECRLFPTLQKLVNNFMYH